MAKFRIVKADIRFISLCPKGANRMPVIWKADDLDGVVDLQTLVKASETFEEDGLLTAVVYAPEVVDSQGECASAEVIKDMAYNAQKNGLQIDIRHDGKPLNKDDAHVAESFIVQKNDPRFASFKDYEGKPVDVTGAWATVIKIDNPDLRKKYRSGEWNGVSMGGTAKRVLEKSEDIEMDKAELSAILKENNKELAASIVSGLTEVAKALIPKATEPLASDKTPETEVSGPPVLKDADKINPTKVKEYRVALTRYNLSKDVDFADEAQVAAYEEALAKFDEENKAAANLRKSNQPTSAGTTTTTKAADSDDHTSLAKSIATLANERRGYTTK